MFQFILNLISLIIKCFIVIFIVGGVFIACLVYFHIKDLPDDKQLAEYNPSTVTRLYTSDGKLLEEYAKEHRIFVPINAVPKQLIQAFLSAEDKNFYSHPGIDFTSLLRAVLQNILNISTNRSLVGGSTITQQVVKNFLLTNERSLNRKIKEAILAFRITKTYTKDRILELYLNQIYLGNGSYGVASAALNYFNKSVDELSIEQAAYLASLPKAPSNYDSKKYYDRAFARRNWVLSRMLEDGFVTREEYDLAQKKPLTISTRAKDEIVRADFFAEEVRKEVSQEFGSQALYSGGLVVHTTLDPELQIIANKAFRAGLASYDERHGYRGPLAHLDINSKWQPELVKLYKDNDLANWKTAIIAALSADKITITTFDGQQASIALKSFNWAKPGMKKPADLFKIGDVIVVEAITQDKNITYFLRQIPKVNGGMIVMDPHTGRILAMVGGFSFAGSEFNRATQAKRQPGSVYKPFVYLAALENGYTPSSIILDGPVSLSQGAGLPMWQPKNYSRDYLGPTTLRRGLEKSRNTMTVRLAENIGIKKIIEVTKRFGINSNPARNFSLALGATETTLLNMTNAYAMIVGGGKRLHPSLVEYIQDRQGKIIYKRDQSECQNCNQQDDEILPSITSSQETVLDPRISYQMISLLEGVMLRGTGASARKLGKTLGGKTGTTNDSLDTWFIGFTPDLVVGSYVGYDSPKSLGDRETGASVALPMFINFMAEALKDRPDLPFRIPAGIKLVKINASTGRVSTEPANGQTTIYEAYKTGSEPEPAQTTESFKEQHPDEFKVEDLFDQPSENIPVERPDNSFGMDNIY